MNSYLIRWWMWPEGARVPSEGEEVEYGEREGEAIRRFVSRYPTAKVKRVTLKAKYERTPTDN